MSAGHEDIVEVLKYVETLNNPEAIGDGGDSWGVLQVQKGVIDDVNRHFGTFYSHKDVFQEECAVEIFHLYIELGTIRFKKLYNKEPSVQDIVRFWNGGIYQGYRIKATIPYYKKYLRWKNKLTMECKIEEWRDIDEYIGEYQVSNFGRVRSLKKLQSEILPPIENMGYLYVTLYKNGKQKKYGVHQLVAMAFLGHEPNGHTIIVDHRDTIKSNNRLNNLQLITQRENSSKDKTGGSSKYLGVN